MLEALRATAAARRSPRPLHADGLQRSVFHLLLLLGLGLLLREGGALVHGLARGALVLVGLAGGGAALLDDVRLRGVEPLVALRAGLHAIALATHGVHRHCSRAVADLLHVVGVLLAAATEEDLRDRAGPADLDLSELL